jgi:PAS domain S-box-containing protein
MRCYQCTNSSLKAIVSSFRPFLAKKFLMQCFPGPLGREKESNENMSRDNRPYLSVNELKIFDKNIADAISDIIYAVDQNGTILSVNRAACIYGFRWCELIGRKFTDVIHHEDRPMVARAFSDRLHCKFRTEKTMQFRMITQTGEIRWLEANGRACACESGASVVLVGSCRDITKSLRNHQRMLKIQQNLQTRVKNRTAKLLQTDAQLRRQIFKRRCVEDQLRQWEEELQKKNANLKKTNTALKMVLNHREEDKKELEKQVLFNIRNLIMPYLEQLKNTNLTHRQTAYIQVLESNINELTFSFLRKLSLNSNSLTSSQLKIAMFVRQGKKTREIAKLTGLSPRTIEAYRLAIRRKLNLANKKVNLRSFLLSLDCE